MAQRYWQTKVKSVTQPILALWWLAALIGSLTGQVPIKLVDVTDQMGIVLPDRLPLSGQYRLPEGFTGRPIPFDFDQDGDLDLLLTYGPHVADTLHTGMNRLYRNDDTVWVDVTDATGLAPFPPAGNAAVGDVNGDGFPDLYLCLFGADRLLLNQGGVSWYDITDSAGISNTYWSSDAVFLDANQDGFLDIYVANYLDYPSQDTLSCFHPETGERTFCEPELYDPAPNRLYINDGSGRFHDMTAAMGLVDSTSRSLEVLLFDANGDAHLDIFVLSYRSPNLLYLGGVDSGFVEVGIPAGVALAPDGSEPAWNQVMTLDANRDGYADLLFTKRDRQMQLLLNDGTGGFFEGRYQTGLFQPRLPYRATVAAVLDLDFNGTDDLILSDPGHGLRSDSLMVSTTDSDFRRFLLSDGQNHYYPVGASSPMVLDTTLLVPIMPTDSEKDVHLEFLAVDSVGRPLFPIFPEEDPFDFPTTDPSEAFVQVSPDTAAPTDSVSTDSTQLDSSFTGSTDQAITTHSPSGKMDTLTVVEEASGYVVVDLTGDGVQEIIATYPVGLVRVWQRELEHPPPFIGLHLRADQAGMNTIGARVTVSAGEMSRRYIQTDHRPVLVYLPEEVRDLSIEVRWPDGRVNHYEPTTLNRYYTLARQDTIP